MADWMSADAIWFLLGTLFLILELSVTGVVFLFFGAGAWVTAIVTFFWDPSLEIQLILFSSISILSLATLRRMVKERFFGASEASTDSLKDEFIDHRAVAETDFDANGRGKVAFRGSSWKAKADAPIQSGEEVRITQKESITLFVEPIRSNEEN